VATTTAVVGAGIFGVTAALVLTRRGHAVTLLDPGPLPHPLAESTDISKVVRLDYGPDEAYTALAEASLAGWRRWNERWPAPLFHETGIAFLCREPMEPGGFEHESYALLRRRGHALDRLDEAAIGARFPAWRAGAFVDGYFNPAGGYAESGKVVAALLQEAEAAGVRVRAGEALARLVERGRGVAGVALASGGELAADHVVVAAGAWTPHLVPSMREHLRAVGQPVFHLAPIDPEPYRARRFPVFTADISRTGVYGFPVTEEGIVKVANHGVGRAMHPSSAEARVVTGEEEAALRRFLGESLPELADSPIVRSRVCVYCDTWDEHFWIARDPEREGLVVAAGGSGHGFKFAPVLGELIADAVEGRPNPALAKFRWRPEIQPPRGEEAARYHG
jgi:glycine/D-amino acid oxidase-like deaminating enzyme